MCERSEFKTLLIETVNLLGGATLKESDLKALTDSHLPLICADKGYLTALNRNLKAEFVIGDLDSVSDVRKSNPDVQFVKIDDQNTTDFDKALDMLTGKTVFCYGFLGARMDHSLSSFSSLIKNPDCTAFLIGERDICVRLPKNLNFNLPKGTGLSVYPMTPLKATSLGLAYPLDGVDLRIDGRLGTSNFTSAERVEINKVSGEGLLVFDRKILPEIFDQWPNNPAD